MSTMEITPHLRKRTPVATMTDPAILVPAIGEAFRKLDPRLMVRNPVMFVVEVVAALTTLLFLRDLVTRRRRVRVLVPDQSLALVHRAVRQFRRSGGRGARQGTGRHPAHDQDRDDGQAAVRVRPRNGSAYRERRCKPGDVVLVEAGDLIPATARSSKASPRSTKRRSPARARRSSAKAAATVRR